MTFIDANRYWSGCLHCLESRPQFLIDKDPERQGDMLKSWQQPRVQPRTKPVSFPSSTRFIQPGGTELWGWGWGDRPLSLEGGSVKGRSWFGSRKAGQVGRKGVSRFPGLPRAPFILGPTSSTPSSEPQDSCLPVLQTPLGWRLQCGSCFGPNSEMTGALLRVSKLLYK